MKAKNAISPTRSENYAEWYQEVIKEADLAENAPVRGCMVIKPWGYGIWERIQTNLDRILKDTGHQNAYFPMLIPLSFFEQEASHVEGFAKECAVVTHRRLAVVDGKLAPSSQLDEPLVIRPTSETIIGAMFAKWIESYRDLPILINQWANVFRWEMRTRLFLRTSEFLWQEGHTAHSSAKEAWDETKKIIDLYESFVRCYLAMPVIKGEKCSWERFPGAVNTFSIEAMMQDGKALQAGTSHFLGQNFSRASNIKFTTESGLDEHAWTTSWGVSTRLIGGLIMTHSDDDGLVLPPRVAPHQIVILPILHAESDTSTVLNFCTRIAAALEAQQYDNEKIRVYLDAQEGRGGEKMWRQIKRGVPIRVEIGPRDVENDTVTVGFRDKPARTKITLSSSEFIERAGSMLEEIQTALYNKADNFQKTNTQYISDLNEFKEWFSSSNGFVISPFVDDPSINEFLSDLQVSLRCALPQESGNSKCIFSGKETRSWGVFARSY